MLQPKHQNAWKIVNCGSRFISDSRFNLDRGFGAFGSGMVIKKMYCISARNEAHVATSLHLEENGSKICWPTPS